jgi:hypothetical protein
MRSRLSGIRSVIADYNARTAVERELVLRLASLLWRIRRATAIETDLLQIQAEIVRERRSTIETASEAEQKLYGIVDRALRPAMGLDTCEPGHSVDDHEKEQINNDPLQVASRGSTTNSRQLTSCFLRLANLDNGVFERLSRYETACGDRSRKRCSSSEPYSIGNLRQSAMPEPCYALKRGVGEARRALSRNRLL